MKMTSNGCVSRLEDMMSVVHINITPYRLDVPERIQFRVATTVYHCLHNMVPRYLSEMCTPIATSTCRQGLRSVTTSNLVIPRVRRVTYGSRAFSVAGPVCWNGLPDYLKSHDLSLDCFKRQLKIFLFCAY